LGSTLRGTPTTRSRVRAMGLEAYDQGRTDIPLLDETIPQNLFHTIEEHENR